MEHVYSYVKNSAKITSPSIQNRQEYNTPTSSNHSNTVSPTVFTPTSLHSLNNTNNSNSIHITTNKNMKSLHFEDLSISDRNITTIPSVTTTLTSHSNNNGKNVLFQDPSIDNEDKMMSIPIQLQPIYTTLNQLQLVSSVYNSSVIFIFICIYIYIICITAHVYIR